MSQLVPHSAQLRILATKGTPASTSCFRGTQWLPPLQLTRFYSKICGSSVGAFSRHSWACLVFKLIKWRTCGVRVQVVYFISLIMVGIRNKLTSCCYFAGVILLFWVGYEADLAEHVTSSLQSEGGVDSVHPWLESMLPPSVIVCVCFHVHKVGGEGHIKLTCITLLFPSNLIWRIKKALSLKYRVHINTKSPCRRIQLIIHVRSLLILQTLSVILRSNNDLFSEPIQPIPRVKVANLDKQKRRAHTHRQEHPTLANPKKVWLILSTLQLKLIRISLANFDKLSFEQMLWS